MFFSVLAASVVSVLLILSPARVQAQDVKPLDVQAGTGAAAEPKSWSIPLETGNAPELGSPAAVLLDAYTGALLFSKNPDEEIPPASLTKLMTMHLILKEASAGKINLDETISPPEASWAVNQPPRSSLMFLAEGQTVTMKEILLGLAIPSGNDAAVAAALSVSPDVEAFAAAMTDEARKFGLSKTRFVEPSGISELNMTTAMEFALFCREYLRLHPETLKDYHSVDEFAYPKASNLSAANRKPQTIVQPNHNNLIRTFAGTDGLKTGYIDESGYNIALTAERGGVRFIAVILGARTTRIRDDDGVKLLAWAFENFKTVKPLIPPLEPVQVWKGKADVVHIAPAGDLSFTTFRTRAEGEAGELTCKSIITDPLIAPIPAGAEVGTLVFSDSIGELRRIPIITGEETEEGNFFKKILHDVQLFFR